MFPPVYPVFGPFSSKNETTASPRSACGGCAICLFHPAQIFPLSFQNGGKNGLRGAYARPAHEEPAAQGAVELKGMELLFLIGDDLKLLGEPEGAHAQGEHGHGGESGHVGEQLRQEGVPEAGAAPVHRLGLVVPVGGKALLIAVRQGIDGGENVALEIPPLPLEGKGRNTAEQY